MGRKSLLSHKWAKTILIWILIAVTAAISSGGTYFYILNKQRQQIKTTENMAIKEVLKDIKNDKTTARSDAFSKTVEKLNQQAHDAMLTPYYPEKNTAVADIGEAIKEILSSDYADLLTNDTFKSDEFSVSITNYPLQNGYSIQRIDYIMKSADEPNEEARFFLRYNGDTTFYSDIEYLGYDVEKDFQVFENPNGCFVFRVLYTYNLLTFSSTQRYSQYYADIYIVNEDSFKTERYVEVPMKVSENDKFSLIQQDNIIKGVISSYPKETELHFNTETYKFEFPKGQTESKPVDYDIPGLLLGLSDSDGNIRTLWIRNENGSIYVDEYTGQIIFPRQNKLFSLKHYIMDKDLYGDESGDDTEFKTGNISMKKLMCAPLGADLTDEYNKIFDFNLSMVYSSVEDIPLYVGEDYVCYIQNIFSSGGGTMRFSPTYIRLDKIDNLKDFIFDNSRFAYGGLVPNFKETTLADLIYGDNAKYLYQSDISTYGGDLQSYVDFKDLSIKRNLGKWSLMLPVMDEYYHPGNGSAGNWVTSFAAYSNAVPDFLTSKEEKVDMGGWDTWSAKDIFKFPGSDTILIQSDYFIGIRHGLYNFNDEYDISVPVNLDEYIVSINFASKDTQETWSNELNNIEDKID